MKRRRVFLIGDSLFAETLGRTLAAAGTVRIIGSAPTSESAMLLLTACRPDAVIVAGRDVMSTAAVGQLLTCYPDLPVICANLGTDDVQVITSHRISARTSDLLAAVAELPRRK